MIDDTLHAATEAGLTLADIAAPELAWSIDTVEEPEPLPSWRDATGRAGLMLAGAALLACAVVGVGVGVHRHQTASPVPQKAAQPPAVAAPASTVTATVTEPPSSPSDTPALPSPAPTVATEAVPVPSGGPRINNRQGFSFVMPTGWVESDATHLDYGSELLSKVVSPGDPPDVANDTRIVMGPLDASLYANGEPDNAKASLRLASDMGEFFMPYPGTRIDQTTVPVTGGTATYYAVHFTDPAKPQGQIEAAVVTAGGQRWFMVWLGTSNDPVDQLGAKALADSIQA